MQKQRPRQHQQQQNDTPPPPDVITQLRLEQLNDEGVPRTRAHFYTGPRSRMDLDDIKSMYVALSDGGRPVSVSVIVRRSLDLLASHLRGVMETEDKDELNQEMAALVQHTLR